jgi:seryl-tRNA synthetase
MLDIKFIREHQDALKRAIKDKKNDLNLDELLRIDEQRIALLQEIEGLNAQKNELNELMKQTSNKTEIIDKGKVIKEKQAELEPKLRAVNLQFEKLMVQVPTIPAEDTPPGESDQQNTEIFRWGELPQFNFKPLTHIELAKRLDIIDFDRGAKVAGYRGYYLKNQGVILVMGLMMYTMQKLIQHGFMPMIPPTLIKQFALFGSGYFKGKDYDSEVDEIYQVTSSDKNAAGQKDQDKKFLVGTAEPSLLAYYSGEIIDESKLPLKICGFSQCYRSEIGSYGKDTKGLYRIHEFMKVEQVIICRADLQESKKFFEELRSISEELLQDLELPYRVLEICTGDMGAGKYRQNDIETWMPSRNAYGETHSNSNLTDWQARRLNLQYKNEKGETLYAYTLNNTVVASPRILIAILENNQQKDGSVRVPKALQEFVGKDTLRPRL